MRELSIREFHIDDLNECVDLYMKTFSADPWNESWESRDIVADFIKLHIQNNYFLGFVVLKDTQIIGVSIGFTKPWINGLEYYIDEFYIDVNHQGKRIGTTFMEEIKNKLIQKDIHVIFLNTERGYPAQKFYEKLGFQVEKDLIILDCSF